MTDELDENHQSRWLFVQATNLVLFVDTSSWETEPDWRNTMDLAHRARADKQGRNLAISYNILNKN